MVEYSVYNGGVSLLPSIWFLCVFFFFICFNEFLFIWFWFFFLVLFYIYIYMYVFLFYYSLVESLLFFQLFLVYKFLLGMTIFSYGSLSLKMVCCHAWFVATSVWFVFLSLVVFPEFVCLFIFYLLKFFILIVICFFWKRISFFFCPQFVFLFQVLFFISVYFLFLCVLFLLEHINVSVYLLFYDCYFYFYIW